MGIILETNFWGDQTHQSPERSSSLFPVWKRTFPTLGWAQSSDHYSWRHCGRDSISFSLLQVSFLVSVYISCLTPPPPFHFRASNSNKNQKPHSLKVFLCFSCFDRNQKRPNKMKRHLAITLGFKVLCRPYKLSPLSQRMVCAVISLICREGDQNRESLMASCFHFKHKIDVSNSLACILDAPGFWGSNPFGV